MSRFNAWWRTLVAGLAVFLGVGFYHFIRNGGRLDLYLANKALATTGLVLVCFSLALSGLSYFWPLFRRVFVYRAYLGMTGFGFAFVHGLISLFWLPERFPFPFYYVAGENIEAFIFGLVALVILGMMAVISNRYAARRLGVKRWRSLLRIGYVALVLILLHFGLRKYPGWLKWLRTWQPLLPPMSLLEFGFGWLVVGLRVGLWLALKHDENREKAIFS